MITIEEKAKHNLSYERDFLGRNLSDNMVCRAYVKGAAEQEEHDIKALSKVYADLLSAKGYDIATINSELARLQKEIKKITWSTL